MLITFRGRISGRIYTTPVRYLRTGEVIRCFTSQTNQWWRNLRGGVDVTLRVEGEDLPYRAETVADDVAAVRAGLEEFLAHYPQDSPYYEVHLAKGRRPVPEDLDRAAGVTVMVEARRNIGNRASPVRRVDGSGASA